MRDLIFQLSKSSIYSTKPSENNSGTAPNLQTAAPTRILQAGGSRINFAAPASEKLSPTTAVYPGGTAPHTVAAKSPAKSR
ncbi:hypothetical protein ARC82_01450 [Escherichia coli]|nr:hypothetical protein ARC82_01450 [Escherichia coli]